MTFLPLSPCVPSDVEQVHGRSRTVVSSSVVALGLTVLFFALTLPPSMLRPFHSKGEPREALVAQAMLESGNWILPKRYEDEFATKPPITHWLAASAGVLSGGVTEFSSRLPSLLLSFCSILLLLNFLISKTSRAHAVWTCIVLLTSVLWYRSSITARVDMPLAAFLTGSLICMFLWEERDFRGIALQFIIVLLLACGVLTKGPVAIVIPGLIWSTYLLALKRPILRIILTGTRLFIPALLIASIWYFLAYRQAGENFLQIVFAENLARLTGKMSSGRDPHQHSIFFLAGTLLAGTFPWSLGLLFIPWKKFYRHLRATNLKHLSSSILAAPRVHLFSTIVCAVIFGFYCIPSSKKAEYLLPMYPFLASLAVATALRFSCTFSTIARKWNITIHFLLALFWIVISALLIFPKAITSALHLPHEIFFTTSLPNILSSVSWIAPLTLLLALILIYRIIGSLRGNLTLPFREPIALYLATLVAIGAILVPPIATELSPKDFPVKTSSLVSSTTNLYTPELFYEIDFYLGGRLKRFDPSQDITSPAYVYVSDGNLQHFTDELPASATVEILATSKNDIRKPGRVLRFLKVS